MKRHCDWENDDFDAVQFKPYRGLIFAHVTADPIHLTNGELPGQSADLPGGGPRGNVDTAPAAPEAPREP